MMGDLQMLIVICLFFYVNLSHQKTTPNHPYYVAGVVEFSPTENGIGSESILEQVEGIREILETSFEEEPDIIVFPEHILFKEVTTYIPDPKENIVPCEQLDFDYVLTELSCLARMSGKYIVININEKALCSKEDKCPQGTLNYNTNVVFDRSGAVVSKYRKSHLYWKEVYNKHASNPETQTFTTDFGVTFGHFICFDLMFYSPAQELVDSGVTDFIYPTYWFQEFPFLTALQLHQGWAHGNNVNFLSAGGSFPSKRNTGSGIFAGEYGALASIISDTPVRKIIVARVPKKTAKNAFIPKMKEEPVLDYSNGIPNRLSNIAWKRDYNVDLFASELLNTSKNYEDHSLCHNNFCCSFSLSFRAKPSNSVNQLRKYAYRIGVYEGPGTLQRMEKTEFGICTIMACTKTGLWSCGNIFTGPEPVGNDFEFVNITIKGDYKKRDRILVMPSTVDSAFQPLPVDSYKYSRTDNGDDDGDSEEIKNTVTYEISLNRPRYDIITFGLYGNYYVDTKSLHNYREEEGKSLGSKNVADIHSSNFLAVLLVAFAVLY
ncbi:BTD family protein [Megaselia abdita]